VRLPPQILQESKFPQLKDSSTRAASTSEYAKGFIEGLKAEALKAVEAEKRTNAIYEDAKKKEEEYVERA
jgi:hypothetical protein